MAITKFLDITGLTEFKNLMMTELMNVVSAEDAKAIKAVSQSSDGYTLYFYKKTNPVSSSEAAFSITLPAPVDITGKMDKVPLAAAGNIAVFKADGSVVDSGTTPSSFATSAQGQKADTAVQEIKESAVKGSICVDGKDIPVKGLTDTAFTPKNELEKAGAALAVKAEVMAALGEAVTDISDMSTQVEQVQASIDSINSPTTGILSTAKKYTDDNITALHLENYTTITYVDSGLGTKANASDVYKKSEIDTKVNGLQNSVNNVKAYVGEIPEGETAKDVISYLKEQIRIAENEASYDDSALKASIKKNTDAIGVLNGTGAGSVSKTVADEIAKLVADAPQSLDTLKEIADWIDSHQDDAAAMNSQINANQEDLARLALLVGQLPEGTQSTTLVGYIAEYVGKALKDSDLSQYAKASDLDSAVGRIAVNEGAITGLKASLAEGGATSQAIAAAKKAGTDAQASVTALAGRMGTVPEGSATLKEYIDKQDKGLSDSIASINSELDQALDSLTGLSDKVDQNTAAITADSADIAKLKTDVANNKSDADALKKYVGTFQCEDTAVKTVVSYIDKKSSDAAASARYDDTTVKNDIKKNQEAINAINNPASGILATAKQYADTKTDNAYNQSKEYTDSLRDNEVAANTAAIGHNASDIEALKRKVGDGFTAITLSEIQAMFADTTY